MELVNKYIMKPLPLMNSGCQQTNSTHT